VTTVYAALGGEAGLRHLVTRFYALMDELPEAAACRAVHPADLTGSAEKFFDYLSFFFGGPPLYLQKRGHPMLRARHLHASIGEAEIRGWLLCFHRAWAEQVKDDPALDAAVLPRIEALAQHMRNTAA
jgi:hemoglobin